MSEFRVHCPQCSKRLVLKDRALLGRKGKCPKCGHRFVLEEPTESVSEETELPSVKAAPSAPPADVPNIDLNVGDDHTSTYQRVTSRSRARSRSWLVSGVMLLVCGTGIAAYFCTRPVDEPPAGNVVSRPAVPSPSEVGAPSSPPDDAHVPEATNDPIQLLMVPSGVRFIVNLRPAELWSDDAHLSELRASLTENLVSLIAEFLQQVTHRRPEQIEEVMFGWILGSRGTAPQLATVVHLSQEERLSDLIEEFGAEPLDELAHPRVYLLDEQAVYVHDESTLAFAPREMADELLDWVDVPNPNTGDGMLDLLPQTDRQDLLTVICEPVDLSRHIEWLFPAETHDVARLMLAWFAEQAETVAWSVRSDEEFASTLLLRGPSTQSAPTLQEQMLTRIEAVPPEVLEAVRQLNPQHAGFRKLIGRLPAMLEVARQVTTASHDERTVALTTVLPPKAGPNLALASILTWNEASHSSTHLDSSTPASVVRSTPKTIVERLDVAIDAEFNRTPLQEAIEYIAGEIGATIEIDGDALKDAGFTKNMPQTFTLGKVPARKALAKIVSQYQEVGKQMVLVVDEQSDTAVLKTRKFAEAAGETPFDLMTRPVD